MIKNILHIFSKIRISTRLILLITFIFGTTLFVDLISSKFTYTPDVYLFERNWLINQITSKTKFLNNLNQEEQVIFTEKFKEDQKWLDLSIIKKDELPGNFGPLPENLISFQESLNEMLHQPMDSIISINDSYGGFSRRTSTLTVITNKLPSRLVDELEDKGRGDISISSDFSIYVPLYNGHWGVFKTRGASFSFSAYVRLFSAPIIGAIMIVIASILTSRSFLKPLKELSITAERLGRERHLKEMPEISIPDYGSIVRAFDDMQAQLKRFIDERTHMLAAVSHDLRTPLTRMRLLVENVKSPTIQRDLIYNLTTMETMVKEYLIFVSEDAKQEEYIPIDIASLLISECDTLSDSGHNIIYIGPNRAQLICQPTAIKRVFINIIDNACKYGEEVKVEMINDNNKVKVVISDKGPGIPNHLIDQAFQPFQRIETSRNRETGGTGLGLSIAKDLVTMHGGTITMKNLNNEGLSVFIEIPKISKD